MMGNKLHVSEIRPFHSRCFFPRFYFQINANRMEELLSNILEPETE